MARFQRPRLPVWIALASVCAVANADPAATVKATSQLTFAPAMVKVHVGDTVEWTNQSYIVHTVTADPGLATLPVDGDHPAGSEPFNSGSLKRGETFSHTFTVAGTYHYFCIPHEGAGMTGKVVVEPKTTDAEGG